MKIATDGQDDYTLRREREQLARALSPFPRDMRVDARLWRRLAQDAQNRGEN